MYGENNIPVKQSGKPVFELLFGSSKNYLFPQRQTHVSSGKQEGYATSSKTKWNQCRSTLWEGHKSANLASNYDDTGWKWIYQHRILDYLWCMDWKSVRLMKKGESRLYLASGQKRHEILKNHKLLYCAPTCRLCRTYILALTFRLGSEVMVASEHLIFVFEEFLGEHVVNYIS